MKKIRRRVARKTSTKMKFDKKMLFVVGSLVLVGVVMLFGTLRKQFFAPEAAIRKKNNKKNNKMIGGLPSPLYTATIIDCAKTFGYDTSVLSIKSDQGRCESHEFQAGIIKNDIKDWQWYGDWKDLKFFQYKYVRCCVSAKGFMKKSDTICSSYDLYKDDGTFVGKKPMRCKLSCAQSSRWMLDDDSSDFNLTPGYYFEIDSIRTKLIDQPCMYVDFINGEYQKKVGRCCARITDLIVDY